MEYREGEVFRPEWKWSHKGVLSHGRNPRPWVYHEGEPFRLLLKQVPPGRIRLVADLNLVHLLEAAVLPEVLQANDRLRGPLGGLACNHGLGHDG